MDREVFITNKDRQDNTRRRLHYYCRVFEELDHQMENKVMPVNVQGLACVSRMASRDALARAMERGWSEATVAQAILLMGMKRL